MPIGRVGGVPVLVHWSVVIIMVLVAWALAGQALPVAFPGRPTWQYVASAICAAAIFLLGLLAHEVSHAVVARRNGVAVARITLWMFGGVAELEGEAATPGAELRIAGVGPLVSLVLGLVFGAGAIVADAAGADGLWVGTLSWLGGINVVLAVFNMLPGAPLDGGRLLRAALWRWRGDQQWATVTAAKTGRALGLLMVVAGLVGLVFGMDLSALWLALIGWFIMGAAAAEQRSAEVAGALAGLHVADVMTPSPDTVPPDVSVALFIDRYLFARRHSSFPLAIDGAPLGLVTMSRIRTVPADRRPWTTLREIAVPLSEIPVVSPGDLILTVLPRINAAAARRALVVDDGALVGIVSPADISRALERSSL